MKESNKHDSEWAVRNQLAPLAKASNYDVQSIMIHYANERFLYRHWYFNLRIQICFERSVSDSNMDSGRCFAQLGIWIFWDMGK